MAKTSKTTVAPVTPATTAVPATSPKTKQEAAPALPVAQAEASTKVKTPRTKKAAPAPAPVTETTQAASITVATEGGDAKASEKNYRFFRCKYNGEVFGRYKGKKPKQAAGKAFTSIIRQLKDTYVLGTEVAFSVFECTRGSNHKESCYVASRTELENPTLITIDGKDKPVVYRFNNKIRKVRDLVSLSTAQSSTSTEQVAAPATVPAAAPAATEEKKRKAPVKKAVK